MSEFVFPDAALFRANTGEPVLRWGVVGPGWIADMFVDAMRAHTAQVVAAVASRSLERANEFAVRHGIAAAYGSAEELIADSGVDAVYVATPATQHAQVGLAAIAAGKHVLIEKPITISSDDAEKLVRSAQDANVLLMEAMWTRYLPQTSVLRRLVADGALGELRALIVDNGQAIPQSPEHRLRRPEAGGGALFDIGIYAVQLSSMLFGAPDTVDAHGAVADTGVDGFSTVVLRHGREAQSVIFSSIESRTPGSATVTGTEGLIRFPRHFANPGSFTLESNDPFAEPAVWVDRTQVEFFDALSWQVNAFAQFVREGRVESPLHTHAETVSIIRTLEAAHDLIIPCEVPQ